MPRSALADSISRIDPELAARISHARKIAGFRNQLGHDYPAIIDDTVWAIADGDAPILRDECSALIDELRRADQRRDQPDPDAAAARGVTDGARRGAQRAQGRGRCPVRVTADVMPGVVALTAGVEPDFDDAGRDVAGPANVLTSDEPTLPRRGATLSCVAVEVREAGRDQ